MYVHLNSTENKSLSYSFKKATFRHSVYRFSWISIPVMSVMRSFVFLPLTLPNSHKTIPTILDVLFYLFCVFQFIIQSFTACRNISIICLAFRTPMPPEIVKTLSNHLQLDILGSLLEPHIKG